MTVGLQMNFPMSINYYYEKNRSKKDTKMNKECNEFLINDGDDEVNYYHI